MSDRVVGKTILWSFDDGPTAGKRFEHSFARDGKVHYGEEGQPKGKADYEVETVGDDVVAVSYLARSGYTLTTILDFAGGTAIAFASNEKELVVQRGTFEVVEGPYDEPPAERRKAARPRAQRERQAARPASLRNL